MRGEGEELVARVRSAGASLNTQGTDSGPLQSPPISPGGTALHTSRSNSRLYSKKPVSALPSLPARRPAVDLYADQDFAQLNESACIEIGGKPVHVTARDIITGRKLGAGQYGSVYKCTVSGYPGCKFAYKDIELMLDPSRKKSIVSELKAAQKMKDCQYAVKTFCQITSGINLWLIMELMDFSAQDLLERSRPRYIPQTVIRAIIFACVSCLDYLKKQGLMHRDVKPSNILVRCSTGEVKLGDFGICGQLECSMAKSKIYQYNYLPPERITTIAESNKPEGYTVKSDIWAVGVTTYELVTGAHPFFVNNSILKTWDRIMKECEKPMVRDGEDIMEDLKDFVSSCLWKDPARRPPYPQLLASPFLSAHDPEGDTAAITAYCREVMSVSDSLE